MNPCCFSGITILKNAGSNDIMKTALAKIKRFFLLIAGTVMIAFSTSGCAFIPTGFYLVSQFDGNPCHIREGNEWPCGNIIHVTNRLIENVLTEPDDEVLPPDLDRALNVFCIAQAYPVSLVFDVAFWPYELWRYYHRPPIPDDPKTNGEKMEGAVRQDSGKD